VATPPETRAYTGEYLHLIQCVIGCWQVPKPGYFRARNGTENDAEFRTISPHNLDVMRGLDPRIHDELR
jgi:hypothetical protein